MQPPTIIYCAICRRLPLQAREATGQCSRCSAWVCDRHGFPVRDPGMGGVTVYRLCSECRQAEIEKPRQQQAKESR